MAEVTASTEYSIVRGGSGTTGPQLSTLLSGSSYSNCFQFCTDLMTNGMKVSAVLKDVHWATCSTTENGNAESFTRALAMDILLLRARGIR